MVRSPIHQLLPYQKQNEHIYLQVNPFLQNALLVKLTEESGIRDAESAASHCALSTRHTTEDVVMQLSEKSRTTDQGDSLFNLLQAS